MKKITERPWGRKQNGGWVITNRDLIEALKKGDTLQFGKVMVATKQLLQLVRLLPYDDCRLSANGRLEIETVARLSRKGKDGHYRTSFTKPKHYRQWSALEDLAWMKGLPQKLVVLRPRNY